MPPKKISGQRQPKAKKTTKPQEMSKEEPMEESKTQRPNTLGESEQERFQELRETAEAVGKLAADAENFRRVVDAFRAREAERFQSGLAGAGLLPWCHRICRWLCSKHCVFICVRLCGPIAEQKELDIEEWREFALATARIAQDEPLLKSLIDALDREDVEAWRSLIAKLQLQRFCHQLCHWLCGVRCQFVCRLLCPHPLITHVSNIPATQINAQGFGAGPSQPVGYTPADDKPNGVGDHPFGGWANVRGVFNIANPVKYKVEYTQTPMNSASWAPIETVLDDACLSGIFTIADYQRGYDGAGWYRVPAPPPPCPPPGPLEAHGMGLYSMGQTHLTDWWTPTVVDGQYYLRLTVQNGMGFDFQSNVVAVRIDNTAPTHPVIQLQLQEPDGSRRDLGCCEKVERGKGNLIVIKLQASDANFSRISVQLLGGCGWSFAIVDTGGTALSKTYNGNLLDTGYPVLTEFLWDPWAAKIENCCYLIDVRIYDRAIVNNYWSGGHGNENWQSITIA